MAGRIRSHRELEVYKRAFDAAMEIFKLSHRFPPVETYALTDQIRRSSRSVCANLAEAWRKRRYEGAFVNKVSDAEAEAAEVQVWIEFGVQCGYLNRESGLELYKTYDSVIRTLVGMLTYPKTWTIPKH